MAIARDRMSDEELHNCIVALMPTGFLEGVRWKWQDSWIVFDPLNDLNAIHQAEMLLSADDHHRFTAHLWMLSPGQHLLSASDREVAYRVSSSTANQRARALVYTIL